MAQDVALLTQWKERLKRQEESGKRPSWACAEDAVVSPDAGGGRRGVA